MAHGLGPQQQAQRARGLGRQLPTSERVVVLLRRVIVLLRNGAPHGRHAARAQRLVDGPGMVFLAGGTHHDELLQVDA